MFYIFSVNKNIKVVRKSDSFLVKFVLRPHHTFLDGWMDGWIKSGRDKISARGPQFRLNVHHTDKNRKIKEKTK
jgi:nitrous oxide reductase